MITRIQKWGHSLALRIPKSIATELDLTPNSQVEIKQDGNQIILIPVKKPRFTLPELLAQINSANLHTEIGTGSPVGKEVW
jgi:antitoxin MazE